MKHIRRKKKEKAKLLRGGSEFKRFLSEKGPKTLTQDCIKMLDGKTKTKFEEEFKKIKDDELYLDILKDKVEMFCNKIIRDKRYGNNKKLTHGALASAVEKIE